MSNAKTEDIEKSSDDEIDSSSPLQSQGTDSSTSNSRAQTSSLGGLLEPLTIFYDKKVNAYLLPRERAENIMRWVESNSAKSDDPAGEAESQLVRSSMLDNLKSDMPLTRKKSLETFLLRRKARLSFENPLPTSPTGSSNIDDQPDE